MAKIRTFWKVMIGFVVSIFVGSCAPGMQQQDQGTEEEMTADQMEAMETQEETAAKALETTAGEETAAQKPGKLDIAASEVLKPGMTIVLMPKYSNLVQPKTEGTARAKEPTEGEAIIPVAPTEGRTITKEPTKTEGTARAKEPTEGQAIMPIAPTEGRTITKEPTKTEGTARAKEPTEGRAVTQGAPIDQTKLAKQTPEAVAIIVVRPVDRTKIVKQPSEAASIRKTPAEIPAEETSKPQEIGLHVTAGSLPVINEEDIVPDQPAIVLRKDGSAYVYIPLQFMSAPQVQTIDEGQDDENTLRDEYLKRTK